MLFALVVVVVVVVCDDGQWVMVLPLLLPDWQGGVRDVRVYGTCPVESK